MMYELIYAVEEWARTKGILDNGTPEMAAHKTMEEALELMHAVLTDDRDEIIDALGDVFVTIIVQAKLQGLNLETCLRSAYNVISKRTGKMVNGAFVKDS